MMFFQHLPIQWFQHWRLLNEVALFTFVLLIVMVGVGQFIAIEITFADQRIQGAKDGMLLRPTSPFCMSVDFCSSLLPKGRLIKCFCICCLEFVSTFVHGSKDFLCRSLTTNPQRIRKFVEGTVDQFFGRQTCPKQGFRGLTTNPQRIRKFVEGTVDQFFGPQTCPKRTPRNPIFFVPCLLNCYLKTFRSKFGIRLFISSFGHSYLWIPLFVPIGEALNPGPNHDLLHINVINPTALLGKIDAITALGKGIHCISESSVTNKAQFFDSQGLSSFASVCSVFCHGRPTHTWHFA